MVSDARHAAWARKGLHISGSAQRAPLVYWFLFLSVVAGPNKGLEETCRC